MKKIVSGKSWWQRWLNLYNKFKKDTPRASTITTTSYTSTNDAIIQLLKNKNGRIYNGNIYNDRILTGSALNTMVTIGRNDINIPSDRFVDVYDRYRDMWCGTTVNTVITQKKPPLTPIKKINKLKL